MNKEIRSFLMNSRTPFVVLKTAERQSKVVLISKGIQEAVGLTDDQVSDYLEQLNLYPEYFIHGEDLFKMRTELHYVHRHRNAEMRVRFRFHLHQEDPFIWFMSYGHYYDESETSLLYVNLYNIEEEQKELRHVIASSKQSHALLEKILDTTQTNIFWKDTSRRFLGANKAFLKYYGFKSLDDILGKTDEEMGWHSEPEQFKKDEERIIDYGETTHRVHGKCWIKGKERDILASKSPLYINGEIAGLVGSFEDVSDEYKQAEEIQKLNAALQSSLKNEEKANQVKSEFMARMSHDMRTPLTTIIGLADLAIDSDSYNSKETFKQVKDASSYLLALINDILVAEKFNSGKMELYLDKWNHEEIMTNIYNIVRSAAMHNGDDFIVDLAGDVGVIETDRKWLMQILINIINNAIKYTPDGGHIEWHETVYEQGDHYIMKHTISDNGVGISESFMREHMYEPFSQEVNKLTKSRTSNGLGLSIVKRAVDLFHGTISCHSVLDQGTTFTIEIPFHKVAHVQKKKAVDYSVLAGSKILIVEDVTINAKIVQAILSNYKIESDIAENGLEALKLAHQQSYDLILMDLKMPVMNGLQATRELRRTGYTKPIIALSANTYQEDLDECRRAGMNDFIEKPVNVDNLMAKVIKFEGKEFV